MTGFEIVRYLKLKNYQVDLRGSDVAVSPVPPEEMIALIKKNKPEIVYYLQKREYGKYIPPDSWEKEGWVLMYSYLLNEFVVLTQRDNVKLPEGVRSLVRYEYKETLLLKGKTDTQVMQIHKIKKVFEGKVFIDPGEEKEAPLF